MILFASAHWGSRDELVIVFVVSFVLPLYFYFISASLVLFGNRFYHFFLYALLLRVVVLGSPAVWSDDIYRYLFDAKIFLNGFSPYLYTPAEVIKFIHNSPIELETLFLNMNSPHFYSVYPLLIQCFFSLGTLIGSFFGSSFLGVQILLLLIDMINLILIRKLYPLASFNSYWLYFGNPILILEGISQMHPEVLLVTGFLLFLITSFTYQKLISFFLLTQLKLNTFIFVLAFPWNRSFWTKLTVVSCLSLIVWKLTVFSDLGLQGSSGIGLFFHTFRFAGIMEPFLFYLLTPFKIEYLSGSLTLGILCCIYIFSFQKKIISRLNLRDRLLFIYSLFLLFSPVIHPWYWIPWIFFMVGKEKMESLVTIISFLSFLSYGLYVRNDFIYYHWIVSVLVLGYYGKKHINYFRQTT
ncbi:hypothetical protein ND861_11855 [Leptospira sp. 2 VSF19]|uniref:DUF2029 domain-containing protein n=1 Tax=Leptospira soteropolitanensis TaxID=2950025 RepID=A0AAW5VH58_9LEPT|nr:hypothetical protein [Leptospira soteropolitanensis]MCW7493331.1 hypothetical protein [Leptospira soteropolitanensis]MCW7501137.1 hypothetical protein [Leptospira soteropolitanensis]MCW7523183.1 hypothetical protein [Leptospira soteropolitanensis]MCW7527044.1 hypothetical protein [Leptospira soteropolitanensis]MCW7530901.1 hypothetical protein [Leptospira soteropolitanensis]